MKRGPERIGRLTRASDIEPKPTYWALQLNGYGMIPVGELTITAGHGEVGKTTFNNTYIIANITRGTLPGYYFGKPRNCIIAANEDSWEHTIIPSLMAAKADMHRVFRFEITAEDNDEGTSISLPADFGELEKMIIKKNVAVTFFDQLLGAIDVKHDTNSAQSARKAIEPLAHMADRTDSVMIGNAHFNKSTSQDSGMRMLNSVEFRNVPRAVIYFAVDKDGTRVMSREKNNLGLEWPSMEYELESRKFTFGDDHYDKPVFVLGDKTERDAQDILDESRDGKRRGPDPTAQNEIGEVLDAMFAQQDTWPRTAVIAELKRAGVSTDPKTVAKARKPRAIRVERVPKPDGTIDYWAWTTRKHKVRRAARTRPQGKVHPLSHPLSPLSLVDI
jgi:hypothetical protein